MKIKPIIFGLIPIGLLIPVLGSQLTSFTNYIAILVGYCAFSLNLILIAYLASALVKPQNDQRKPPNQGLLLLVGGLKLSFLVAVLFVSIIHFKLPPLFLGIGSIMGLIVIGWFLIVGYLKQFSAPTSDIN